jgi:excisionase family DNA binding protein
MSEVDQSVREGAADRKGRQTFTIDEAAAQLGIGRNLAYKLASEGGLPVVRLGKRLLVPKAALEKLLGVGA